MLSRRTATGGPYTRWLLTVCTWWVSLACGLDVDGLVTAQRDGGTDVRQLDGGTGQGTNPPVDQPPPHTGLTISEVTASEPLAGASAVTLTVKGTGFREGSKIRFLNQTYLASGSDTRLTASSVDLPVRAGTYEVSVVLPDKAEATGGLIVNNVVPTLGEITASSLALGATNVTVRVAGSQFVSGAKVSFGGANCVLPCKVTVEGGVLAFGPVGLPTSGQEVVLVVTNPSPTLGSATKNFSVPWPAPTVSGYSLSADGAGSSGVTLKIVGKEFAPGATVTLPSEFSPNGEVSATSVNANGTELTVSGLTLPSAIGNYGLVVTNPSPRTGVPGNLRISIVGDGTSCAGLASVPGISNCGDGTQSCCTSLPIPGGPNERKDQAATVAYAVTVNNVRLDEFEVSVGRFRRFVDAWVDGWRPKAGSGKHGHLNGGKGLADGAGGYESGWDKTWESTMPTTKAAWDTALSNAATALTTWTTLSSAADVRPATHMDWREAYAFCIWDGGFLPSEAEWQYAASGGNQGRLYPWQSAPISVVPTSNHANFGCEGDGLSTCSGATDPLPPGSKSLGVARWGQLDMAGNVGEWTLDSFAPFNGNCTNCFQPLGTGRVVRGGGFSSPSSKLSATYRESYPADTRQVEVGLRCARPPIPACEGHGMVSSGGTCSCVDNWTGATCNQCAAGYAGDQCQFSDEHTCRGLGTAKNDGTCLNCSGDFKGPTCNECPAGYADSNGNAPGGTCARAFRIRWHLAFDGVFVVDPSATELLATLRQRPDFVITDVTTLDGTPYESVPFDMQPLHFTKDEPLDSTFTWINYEPAILIHQHSIGTIIIP